ncbi:hypothetical protein GCM10010198_49170 [Nocardia seriolae]|nr:hypothetical protein NSER024013_46600 [Nocardia seriolae]GEM26362.1 hypothetical protein NS2_46010 [Nocardia seriolae NBRC 15557]
MGAMTKGQWSFRGPGRGAVSLSVSVMIRAVAAVAAVMRPASGAAPAAFGLVQGRRDLCRDRAEFGRVAGVRFAREVEGHCDIRRHPARASGQDDHAGGHEHRLGHRVGDEHSGEGRSPVQGAHLFVQALAGDLVQCAEGLVEQEQFGGSGQGASDGGAHTHAAGKLCGLVVLEAGQTDQVQG